MAFNTTGVKSEEKKAASQYFGWGEQELKINKFEVQTSKTGSKKVVLHMESRPVSTSTYPDFKAHADSTNGGQIGKASMYGYWLKDVNDENSPSHKMFQKDVVLIAEKMGVREKLDNISAEDFDDYVNKLNSVLTGVYKFWKITVEEYPREGKQPGTKYALGRYSKETICVADVPGKIKFDKNNAFDYKKVEAPAESTQDTDGLPF